MAHTPDDASDTRVEGGSLVGGQFDPTTVEAVGKLSAALETVEVARGHLYQFHRLSGTADFEVEEAIGLLRKAGHAEFADELETHLLGRNVLPGRWTFQVVEGYDETYYQPFRGFEERSRQLTGGHRHLYEAQLKRDRRSPGVPGHEATPASST
ncbi:hypothetical protein FHX82_005407 [Amycolatopsis bartoniae]|uniref:Uncharacterized protein n=1 Tax=Amycolatopsis bartoniae TaxID=941986 RepID=A0A8H9IRZ8_9PSEU|nr:hypothetical protein [Amycolatopsis bartoniae]MBB2938331.1 hypothetical protein [Amycolatopsis bartoniae]GHF34391.1 hypothetical protein GCM10017566_03850 [Amycolatopsis bartoniae]